MVVFGVWVSFIKREVKYQVLLEFLIVSPWQMWVWLG